jgi:hypothetical protein
MREIQDPTAPRESNPAHHYDAAPYTRRSSHMIYTTFFLHRGLIGGGGGGGGGVAGGGVTVVGAAVSDGITCPLRSHPPNVTGSTKAF